MPVNEVQYFQYSVPGKRIPSQELFPLDLEIKELVGVVDFKSFHGNGNY